MASMLSAGVQVKEIDLSGIIPSVATSEGGFAGQFNWGPVNERVLLESEDELVRTFGKPDSVNSDDWFTASNFLAYSNQLWNVRVVNETDANTSNIAKNATVSNTSGVLVTNRDVYENSYSSGILQTTYAAGPWIAKYAGALGNSLKVSVCPSAAAYESTLTGTLTVVAGNTAVTGTGTTFQSQLIVGDLLVINNETVKVASIASNTALVIETNHVGGATANTSIRRWEYYTEVDGAPGTTDFAAARGGSNDEMHIVIIDEDGLFTGQPKSVLEKFQRLSKASDSKLSNGTNNYYVKRINTESSYVWWASHDTNIVTAGQLSTVAHTAYAKPISSSLVGGSDGIAIGNNERIKGFNLYKSKEDVEIGFILGAAANQTVAVNIINNIVEKRMDCVAFFSPPRVTVVNNVGNEAVDVVNFTNTLPSTSYGVIDSGWKYQYDKYNDVYRYVPMNGDTAGVHVRTDQERDEWWSGAGFNRGHIKNVIKLSWNPSQTDRDYLYKNRVNPVATFPGEGTVLFGNKTMLTKPSAFDRINVRRLFITLEKAISKAAKYMLFEFNDEFTRLQFVNMVEPYLRDVQGRRGITSFKVVCDESNNTAEVIDRNEFNATIFIAPARTAEFITLTFVATRTGVDFQTLVGKV